MSILMQLPEAVLTAGSTLAAIPAYDMIKSSISAFAGQLRDATFNRAADKFIPRIAALFPPDVPENHHVLKAMHAAFVNSVKQMAKACDSAGGDSEDRFSREALHAFVQSAEFADLNLEAPNLPVATLETQIRTLYGQQGKEPKYIATEQALELIEKCIGRPLSHNHRAVFFSGHATRAEEFLPWADYFEIYFSEDVKNNQQLYHFLTTERITELLDIANSHSAMLLEILDAVKKLQTSPVSVAPFELIAEVERLYGDGSPDQIVPSKQDYAEGRVHCPALLTDLQNVLQRDGGALVSGHGASGKTTLSILLCHQPWFQSMPHYYLDLAKTLDQQDIAKSTMEAMQAFGDDQTVFVIDNAHLATETASTVVNFWQKMVGRPKLLLLARKVAQKNRSYEVDPGLSRLHLAKLDLVNTKADLEGVYRRLHYKIRSKCLTRN
jgi:hypothetical protein